MALTNQIPAPKEPQKADCSSTTCSADLVARMRAEAQEFNKCESAHEARGNISAASVACRASWRLTQYADELERQNDKSPSTGATGNDHE